MCNTRYRPLSPSSYVLCCWLPSSCNVLSTFLSLTSRFVCRLPLTLLFLLFYRFHNAVIHWLSSVLVLSVSDFIVFKCEPVIAVWCRHFTIAYCTLRCDGISILIVSQLSCFRGTNDWICSVSSQHHHKPNHAGHVLQLNVERLSTPRHNVTIFTVKQWSHVINQ